MFGGVTSLNESLSLSIKKEIITLIMGPLTQILFLIFIYYIYTLGYVTESTFSKFYTINIFLLKFNLLPILPLDGGKLVNNTLDLIFSYNLSHKLSLLISFISIPLLFTFDNKLFIIISCIFLIIQNIEGLITHKYRINKLILERKLHYYKFKKTKEIKSIYNIKRNENFTIEINGLKLNESDYFKLENNIKGKKSI